MKPLNQAELVIFGITCLLGLILLYVVSAFMSLLLIPCLLTFCFLRVWKPEYPVLLTERRLITMIGYCLVMLVAVGDGELFKGVLSGLIQSKWPQVQIGLSHSVSFGRPFREYLVVISTFAFAMAFLFPKIKDLLGSVFSTKNLRQKPTDLALKAAVTLPIRLFISVFQLASVILDLALKLFGGTSVMGTQLINAIEFEFFQRPMKSKVIRAMPLGVVMIFYSMLLWILVTICLFPLHDLPAMHAFIFVTLICAGMNLLQIFMDRHEGEPVSRADLAAAICAFIIGLSWFFVSPQIQLLLSFFAFAGFIYSSCWVMQMTLSGSDSAVSEHQSWVLRMKAGKLFFGSNSKGDVALTYQEINHHVHVVGQTGFGKTVFLSHVLDDHIVEGRGVLFVDLKADLDFVGRIIDLCARSNRLGDLKIFDLSAPEHSIAYNPLTVGTPMELKDKLIGAFEWSEPYYQKAAESFLIKVFGGMCFLRDESGKVFGLAEVLKCIDDPDCLVALAAQVSAVKIKQSLFQLSEDLRNGRVRRDLQGLRTDLELLVHSDFGALLEAGASGLSLMEAIRSKSIVYVMLDSQRFGETAKRLGRLILQDLKTVSATIVHETEGEGREVFTVIVDEFADLVSEPFVGFLNRARASKIGVVIAHQEIADLNRISPDLCRQIMGNTATTISFLQKLPESAELLSGIAGTRAAIKTTTSTNLVTKEQSISEREVEEFQVHPNVFKNELGVGECVIIRKYPKSSIERVSIWPMKSVEARANADWTQINLPLIRYPAGALDLNIPDVHLRSDVRKKGGGQASNAEPTIFEAEGKSFFD